MYKELIDSYDSASEGSFAAAELRIGYKFTTEYVNFCRRHNGAILKNANISLSENKNYELRKFIPIEKVGISDVELWDDRLLAIAEDSSGNFFVFRKPDLQTVYFWDHETEELQTICDHFHGFLELIDEQQLDDIVIPNDTKGWVNPAFMKKQKDLGNA